MRRRKLLLSMSCLLLVVRHGSSFTLSPTWLLSHSRMRSSRSESARFRHARLSFEMAEESRASVLSLYRFAVKGMDGDPMQSVALRSGEAFPYDRRWAVLRGDRAAVVNFDPENPKWVHKENFFCAFTKGEALSSLASHFDDDGKILSVRLKERDDVEPIKVSMADPSQLHKLEQFLCNEVFNGEELRVVSADMPSDEPHRHQFGNTASGVKHNGDTRTVHIVNANTVQQVSEALGVDLDPARFRANIVVHGMEPWSEFDWVGAAPVTIGSAQLTVIKRTVRCAGINVSPATGKNDLDLPRLLAEHFPQYGPYLGVYAQVVGGGTIAVGDEVRWTPTVLY